MKAKPIILTFVGNYLPGYKAGGILRTIVNTVDHLCSDFDFRIVTRDRDLGEDEPYPDIKHNQWQQVGNARVYYLLPQDITGKKLSGLIENTPHHVLYLNSFFDPLTVKVLWLRKIGRIGPGQFIVAPRGEFAWGSLGLKYFKKGVYIQLARFLGLYNDLTWHASSDYESLDITKTMRVQPEAIHTAMDLPSKIFSDGAPEDAFQHPSDSDALRIVFLSRIAREKNLDYALRVLGKVRAKVVFDIYGPAEDIVFWNECQELIARMPGNVNVNYLGSVRPSDVTNVFSRYDLFFFPTAGENYGHVIAESLTSGTPVLLSTKTPWRDMQDEGFGWDIDLSQIDSFVEVIEQNASSNRDDRLKNREIIKKKIMVRLLDPAVLEANRQLFKSAMLS